MNPRAAALAAVALGLTVAVAGCSDPHAGMHCVRSHDEQWLMPITTGGKYPTTYFIPETDTVCDQWVPNPSPTPGKATP